MRILAIERELNSPVRPDLHDILRAEAAGVWDLQKHGIIRDIWFTVPGHRAILMLEGASMGEARGHLDRLPLVRHGLCDFEVLELSAYDGFERLFSAGLTPAQTTEQPPEY
jgi:hypothetical protein